VGSGCVEILSSSAGDVFCIPLEGSLGERRESMLRLASGCASGSEWTLAIVRDNSPRILRIDMTNVVERWDRLPG
jgi:hypothetical protein